MSNTYQHIRDREDQQEFEQKNKLKFEREERYIVLKIKDLEKYTTLIDWDNLNILLKAINYGRYNENKKPIDCVVVESDWTIYEEVWDLVEREYNNNE